MKKCITIIIGAMAVAATVVYAAEQIAGDYNTSLGYLAGKDATGNRATVHGAGAGGEAAGLVRTDLVGAAAGMYATNMTDCVGIGFGALACSRGVSNVVAIGAGAFTNRVNLVDATWINGQFFAQGSKFDTFDIWDGGEFIVKPSPSSTNAPVLKYKAGTLDINAFQVNFNSAFVDGLRISNAESAAKAVRLCDDAALDYGFDVSYTYSQIVERIRDKVLEYIRTNGVANAWVTNKTTATLRN